MFYDFTVNRKEPLNNLTQVSIGFFEYDKETEEPAWMKLMEPFVPPPEPEPKSDLDEEIPE